jgi:hypothetical protein
LADGHLRGQQRRLLWQIFGRFGKLPQMAILRLDPSRPCQVRDDLLALWLPRGRGCDALADGLVATVDVCANPACHCTKAILQAHRIDDRAEQASAEENELRTTWRMPPGGPPQPESKAVLEIDITTGEVTDRGGGKPPAAFSEFFEEPLPFWVLDHLWSRWRAPRLLKGIDWKKQALELWAPGDLLSTMVAFPEERPDRYLVEGKVYQVDTLFCVNPSCSCTESHLTLYEFNEVERSLSDLGIARLPPETMIPVGFDGEKRDLDAFTRVYMAWRRRNVPAEERILELRDMTRRRGLELHNVVDMRSRAAEPVRPAPSTSRRPGRNDPCPCGSGKKFKRCCGR